MHAGMASHVRTLYLPKCWVSQAGDHQPGCQQGHHDGPVDTTVGEPHCGPLAQLLLLSTVVLATLPIYFGLQFWPICETYYIACNQESLTMLGQVWSNGTVKKLDA